MQKLYRISGCGQTYSFLEYVCPKLDKKIDIEIPDEFIDNETISIEDDLDDLLDMGLIDDIMYETIAHMDMEDTVYFAAEEIGDDQWRCCRLLRKGDRLVGRLPNWFDKYRHQVFFVIYTVCYFMFVFFFLVWSFRH